MSRTVYYHFIMDNKRRCAPFFQSRRTSRLHIGVTSMDMPRERAAILRQRDASEHYIFRSLLQRPSPSADTCYFFISIQWRVFSPQSGNQRFVTLHYPLRSDGRRRFYTLRIYLFSRLRPDTSAEEG